MASLFNAQKAALGTAVPLAPINVAQTAVRDGLSDAFSMTPIGAFRDTLRGRKRNTIAGGN